MILLGESWDYNEYIQIVPGTETETLYVYLDTLRVDQLPLRLDAIKYVMFGGIPHLQNDDQEYYDLEDRTTVEKEMTIPHTQWKECFGSWKLIEGMDGGHANMNATLKKLPDVTRFVIYFPWC